MAVCKRVFLLIFLVLLSCKKDGPNVTNVSAPDTESTISPQPPREIQIESLQYTTIPIKNFAALKRLRDSLGAERMLLVLKLNRRDLAHIRNNDTLIVPRVFDEERLSPFPHTLDKVADIEKLIIISQPAQAFAVYANGKLIRWGPVSSGRKAAPTPTGLFSINWKKELKVSSVDSTWIMPWAMNIHSKWGVNLHQYSLPGYPASHSCVRLLEEDAKWLFDWVDTWMVSQGQVTAHGTPVIIFGVYAFGIRPLWKRLPQDPDAQTVTQPVLDSLFSLYKPQLLDRQELRSKFLMGDTLTASRAGS